MFELLWIAESMQRYNNKRILIHRLTAPIQLPAFLLMTLAYAFWFSFCGLPLKLDPTAWPIAWLVLAALVLINPFPVFYPYSRRWILRKSGGLFMSGTRRVEVSNSLFH